MRTLARMVGPAFTALMIGGIAACLHGPAYAQGGGATFLAVVLGVCWLVSARSVQVASLFASWVLPIVWLVGAATRIERCKCKVPKEPLTRPAEHFGTVVFVLFIGALGIYLLARRPVRDELPRVRVLDR
jgi:hypothetical protein